MLTSPCASAAGEKADSAETRTASCAKLRTGWAAIIANLQSSGFKAPASGGGQRQGPPRPALMVMLIAVVKIIAAAARCLDAASNYSNSKRPRARMVGGPQPHLRGRERHRFQLVAVGIADEGAEVGCQRSLARARLAVAGATPCQRLRVNA